MWKKTIIVTLILVMAIWIAPHHIQATDGDTPTTGEIVINEIMINPAGNESAAEWFELYNTTSETRDLNGCSVSDGEGTYTWSTSTIIQPGQYFVLCYDDTDASAPPTCDTVYGSSAGSLQLSNSGDNLELSCGGTIIDAVPGSGKWSGGFDRNGQSQEFNTRGGDPATENDNTDKCGSTDYWCDTPKDAAYNYAGSEYGTPGAKNTDWTGPNAITFAGMNATNGVSNNLLIALLAGFSALLFGGFWLRRRTTR